jgi:hypothetical protein
MTNSSQQLLHHFLQLPPDRGNCEAAAHLSRPFGAVLQTMGGLHQEMEILIVIYVLTWFKMFENNIFVGFMMVL